MEKYITNNDRRPIHSGFYRVIYSDGNTGVEYFDGTTWQVEYSHPIDRWLEEMQVPSPGSLGPQEWLEQNRFTYPANPDGWKKAMQEYAAYVAAHAREEALKDAAKYVENSWRRQRTGKSMPVRMPPKKY